MGPGGPVVSTCCSWLVLSDGWVGQAAMGGPARAVCAICFQALSQSQSVGRCSLRRRAERASRPGTLISWARMVAVVALAWKVEARTPAERVRVERDGGADQPGAVRGERPRG